MSDVETRTMIRAPRWMQVAFVLSLAVNLLVLGVVLGGLAGRERLSDPLPRQMRALGNTPFVAALSGEDRAEFARAATDSARSLPTSRSEMRAHFQQLMAALLADPYDAGAVQRLFAEQSAHLAERQALGQRLLMDQLAEMTVPERREYVFRLRHNLARAVRGQRGE